MTHTALIVIDMQNGFLHPQGSIPRAGMTIPDAAGVIARTSELVSAARSLHLPVIHTRHSYRLNGLEMPPWYRRAARPVLETEPHMLRRGSWDAEIVTELTPNDDGIVIDKVRFDAFMHTDLNVVLHSLGVENLILAGVVTNLCVESTARSAKQRDYAVSIASDCTGSLIDQHEPSLESMRAAFIDVEQGAALLDAVELLTRP